MICEGQLIQKPAFFLEAEKAQVGFALAAVRYLSQEPIIKFKIRNRTSEIPIKVLYQYRTQGVTLAYS
jgi:hypothetical protein